MNVPTCLQAPLPVTVMALVTIAEDEPMALAEYLRVSTLLLERVGAKITNRFVVSEMVVGAAAAQTVVMVRYPSRDAVDAVFKSPEYRALIPLRDRAFLTYKISIVTE